MSTVTAPSSTALVAPQTRTDRPRSVRWELAAALRTFAREGYEFGFNGHVSARAPEAPGHYWVNPVGISAATITAGDLVLVDDEGAVVGAGASPINGFAGNLRLHQQVPDAEVAIHLHTPYGFIWSNLGLPLEAVTTDAALVVGLQGLTRQTWGEPDGPTSVDRALAGARVILQAGHGFLTLGRSVGEAAFYLVAAERAAHQNVALLPVAERAVLPPDAVDRWTLTPELAEAHFETSFTRAAAQGVR